MTIEGVALVPSYAVDAHASNLVVSRLRYFFPLWRHQSSFSLFLLLLLIWRHAISPTRNIFVCSTSRPPFYDTNFESSKGESVTISLLQKQNDSFPLSSRLNPCGSEFEAQTSREGREILPLFPLLSSSSARSVSFNGQAQSGEREEEQRHHITERNTADREATWALVKPTFFLMAFFLSKILARNLLTKETKILRKARNGPAWLFSFTVYIVLFAVWHFFSWNRLVSSFFLSLPTWQRWQQPRSLTWKKKEKTRRIKWNRDVNVGNGAICLEGRKEFFLDVAT